MGAEIGTVQNPSRIHTNDLSKHAEKWIFTWKDRRWYNRERAESRNMKYELLNQDLQYSVAKIKLNIQAHHLDIIDGVPDHCLEIAIAHYLYSKQDGDLENKILDDSKKEKCESV